MSDAQHTVSGRGVLGTFVALVLLSAATFGLSFAPLGAFHVPVALAIASAKAVLVVFFFMELIDEPPSVHVAIVVWVLLLGLLVGLTAADPATRQAVERPPVTSS